MRCSTVRPIDWRGVRAPVTVDSWSGLWFRLTHQTPEVPVLLDPFAEPVRLVLPV